ncbi:hypothetical protein, partial [Sphingopyxis sp.]|uniref:hypothetical protein n=1 Tax=Sphingopyxis sp. TaxID=1908224 RepID=UPI002EDAD9F7
TGPFSILLFALVLLAKDPFALVRDPAAVLGSLVSMLAFGSILGVVFGLLIGWLPISLLGWATAKAAARAPIFRHPVVWVGVGTVTAGPLVALLGGAIDNVIENPDPANWEQLCGMAAFGGGCGIFAALFFRWLIARRSP